MFIRGGLVSFKAGLVETADDDVIFALSGALDVEPIEEPIEEPAAKKQQKPKGDN